MKLNIGCGPNKIEGYINIDSEECVNPDVLFDMATGPLPYEDGSIEEIVFFHCIEHVKKNFHEAIIRDFVRVLKPDGKLYISYPNFEVCAKYWLDNKDGSRKFWEKTIYGRQLHEGDFHVSAISPDYMSELLLHCGFKHIMSMPEETETYNTITYAVKSSNPPVCYETIVKKQLEETIVEGV